MLTVSMKRRMYGKTHGLNVVGQIFVLLSGYFQHVYPCPVCQWAVYHNCGRLIMAGCTCAIHTFVEEEEEREKD